MMFSFGGSMKYKSWDDRLSKTFCQSCDELYNCHDPCNKYLLAEEMAEILDSLAHVFETVARNGEKDGD